MHCDTLKPYQVTRSGRGYDEPSRSKMVQKVANSGQIVRATSASTHYYPQRAIQVVRVREFRSPDDDHRFTNSTASAQSHHHSHSTSQNGTNGHHHHQYQTAHKNKHNNRKSPEKGTNTGNVFECHQALKFVVRSEEMNVLVYNAISPLTFILPIVIEEVRDAKVPSPVDSIPFSANTTVTSYKKVQLLVFMLWFLITRFILLL